MADTWSNKKKGKRSGIRGFLRLLPVLMADKWTGTLTVEERKAEMIWLAKDNWCLRPEHSATEEVPAEPGEKVYIRQWIDSRCVAYVKVKNNGNDADTPRYKLIVGGTVYDEWDDPAGALAAGATRDVNVSFDAPSTEGDHAVEFKVWAKNDETEPA